MLKRFAASLVVIGGVLVASAEECGEKSDACHQTVKFNISTAITGLIDEPPREVFETFVSTSIDCLRCVDSSAITKLDYNDPGCSGWKCRRCGTQWENRFNCRPCCGNRRSLSDDAYDFVDVSLSVCMDDVSPLDSSSLHYFDYESMLNDFQTELATCYSDTDAFYSSWSSACAENGIDLSLMTKDGGAITFGVFDLDTSNAQVVVYKSSDSHQSTSHMIFYTALGFIMISAFAVIGTVVVINILNKRRESAENQSAKWISELTCVETPNPICNSN